MLHLIKLGFKLRRVRLVYHVACMVIQNLAKKLKGMISLGRPRHGWEDNVKICV
jgi:hypothetical protein